MVEGREAKNLNVLKKTGKQGILVLHCIICGRCYMKKPGSLFTWSLVALAATMIESID